MPRPAAKKKPATPKIAPEAVLFFVKQAALEGESGVGTIQRLLGVDAATAKEILAELGSLYGESPRLYYRKLDLPPWHTRGVRAYRGLERC